MELQFEGLIPLLLGIMATFIGFRLVPEKPQEKKEWESFHKNYGKWLKILGPFLLISGLAFFLGFI